MKKAILLTVVICFSLFAAKAQLANTKWKGIIKIPSESGALEPYGVTWDFQTDTASVTYDNGMKPDVMVYWTEKDKVSFKKVSGSVPCDTATVLTCSYEIKNDRLYMKMIHDDCKARAGADASQPFDRVK